MFACGRAGYLRGVKLSVKSDYAARAVLSLARNHSKGRVMKVEELAAENGIPANYLVQILIELKSRNIVRSVRGKEGGYLLARLPSEITLGQVLRCIHPGQRLTLSPINESCAFSHRSRRPGSSKPGRRRCLSTVTDPFDKNPRLKTVVGFFSPTRVICRNIE